MNQATAKKMIENMKAGTVYGIFNGNSDAEIMRGTPYHMEITTAGNVYFNHFGQYCIKGTARDLSAWINQAMKKCAFMPVRMARNFRYYAI